MQDHSSFYRQAREYLDRVDGSQALALLAEVEPTFRTHTDLRRLRHALMEQSLAHWRASTATLAVACALIALQVAEVAGDGFAAGCIAFQLAGMALEQHDYRKAADHLAQAQSALDRVGLAPAGGVLAAAAQLCTDIDRWQQACARGQIRRRAAEIAITEMQGELMARLNQAIIALQASRIGDKTDGESDAAFLILPPPTLAAPGESGPSRLALWAWLAQWWRRLLHQDGPRPAEEPLHTALPVLPPADAADTVA